MSKKFPHARMTFWIFFVLSILFLGWGYSTRDVLQIENGRLTLHQMSRWGFRSRLIEQRTKVESVAGGLADVAGTRETHKFKLEIKDDKGNSVPLPDTMRMADWQVNRSVKRFNQAVHEGSHRINGYPYRPSIIFGYISLFVSLLYLMVSMKK